MRHISRCDATGNYLQFLVLRTMCSKVLWYGHGSLCGGHIGQKKTKEHFATDILGPFQESTQVNRNVLAVINYFTKRVEVHVIP